jgi:hypothetical protein
MNRGTDASLPMNSSTAILPQALTMLPQWSSLFPGMLGTSIPMNNNQTNPQMLQETLNALYAASLPQLNMMPANSNLFQQHAELLQQLSRGNVNDDASVSSKSVQFRSL